MTRNYVYVFQRQVSRESPPRFEYIVAKLEEIGISKLAMSHPERDPNKIEITTCFSGNIQKLEGVLREFGYSLSEDD